MTTTITKRADELKPGDVVMTEHGQEAVVLRLPVALQTQDRICVWVASAALGVQGYASFDADALVFVESPVLTPAQQHADQLAAMVLRMANMMRDGAPHLRDVEAEARALLAKIDPPQPPTLEEALGALSSICDNAKPLDYTALNGAQGILDRARRAKIIP